MRDKSNTPHTFFGSREFLGIVLVSLAGLIILGTLSATLARTASVSAFDERDVESAINHLNSNSSVERIAAVRFLAETKTNRASEGLISALDNSDQDVREMAVHALVDRVKSRSLSERSVEGLIHGLDSSTRSVRREAARGLALADSDRSIEGLIHGLDNSDAAVQETAVEALVADVRAKSSDRVIEGLIHALDNSEYPIRRSAVNGLRNAHSDRARDGLKKALNDSDERIRRAAKEALGQ
jgi:HEAT repeat protein